MGWHEGGEGVKKAGAAGDRGDAPTKTCRAKAASGAEPHRHRGGGWTSRGQRAPPQSPSAGAVGGSQRSARRRPGPCPRRSAAHLCWRRCRAARRRDRAEGGGRRRGAEGRPSRRRRRVPIGPTPSLPRRRRRAGTAAPPAAAPRPARPRPALQHDVTGGGGSSQCARPPRQVPRDRDAGRECGTGMRDRHADGARRPLLASPLPARTSAERGDGCGRLPGEGESLAPGAAAEGRGERGDRGDAGARGCRSHPEPGLGLIRAELLACRTSPRRGVRAVGSAGRGTAPTKFEAIGVTV